MHSAVAPGTPGQFKAAQEVQYHSREFLGLSPLKLRENIETQNIERKRSYFNFISFLRIPFSEVQVSVSVSLEGTGERALGVLHPFPTHPAL